MRHAACLFTQEPLGEPAPTPCVASSHHRLPTICTTVCLLKQRPRDRLRQHHAVASSHRCLYTTCTTTCLLTQEPLGEDAPAKGGSGLGGSMICAGEGEEEVLLYFGIIDILQVRPVPASCMLCCDPRSLLYSIKYSSQAPSIEAAVVVGLVGRIHEALSDMSRHSVSEIEAQCVRR
eukprot:1143255-Pelagomonas_calceolata.AAC.3